MWLQNLWQAKTIKFLRTTVITTIAVIAIAMSMLKTPAIDTTLIRKNVVNLTPQEKADFVAAIKTLKNIYPQGSSVSLYEQFVAIHMGAMAMMSKDSIGPAAMIDVAHGNDGFLAWHREYLARFEKALQSVNPNVTVPYWDWTDPKAIDIIFQPDFLGTNGSGVTINVPGAGTFEGGGPIEFGNFSQADGWVLKEDLHLNQFTNKTLGKSLLRFIKLPPLTNYPISKTDIDKLLNIDDYPTFRLALEGDITVDENGNRIFGLFNHNYIHGLVGGSIVDLTQSPPVLIEPIGTMSNVPSSPSDPVFWLHHANVDRLWAQWQKKGHAGIAFYPATGQPFGHNLNDRMWPWDGGLSTPGKLGEVDIRPYLPILSNNDIVTPADTLDFRKYRYTYDTQYFSVKPKRGNMRVHDTNSRPILKALHNKG